MDTGKAPSFCRDRRGRHARPYLGETGRFLITAADILDLRSALEFLAGIPGQLATTRQPVDAHVELAAIYKRFGTGPALLFENVKGYAIPVVTGILATASAPPCSWAAPSSGCPSTCSTR